MKEITCPYSWDCGKTFETKDLSAFDFDFLQTASKKGMAFMIIHCPECTREFKFNTVEWKADQFGFSDPNITIEKKKKTIKQLNTILAKAKIEIPLLYLDYLTSEKFKGQVSVFEDEEDFNLYDFNELCEKIKVDAKSYLTIEQLKGYADSLKHIIEETPKEGHIEQLTLAELSNGLTIGYENTRILFIDNNDSNSLWIFHPDGGGIEKTNMTVEKLVNR